jgi:hypothetical protein
MKKYKCINCGFKVEDPNIEKCPHCDWIVTYTPDGCGICMDDCIIGTQFIEIK